MILGAISKLEEADFRDANNCRTCSDRTPMNKVVRCKSCTADIGEDVLICALCAIIQHKEHDVAKLASLDEVRNSRGTNDNNDKYVHDAKPALMDSFKSVEHELEEMCGKICDDYQAVFTMLDVKISSEHSRPDSNTLENALNKSNNLSEHFKANVENKTEEAVTEFQEKLRLVLDAHQRGFHRQFKEPGSSKNAGARPKERFVTRFSPRVVDFPPLSPSSSAAGQR